MAGVLKGNPHIDEFHYFEKDLQKTVLELVPLNFSLVFDLQKNFRSRYVTALLKQAFNSQVQLFSFHKLNIRKWLAVQLKWKSLLPDKSIVDRYFEGVRSLGIRNDGLGLEFHIPLEDEISGDDLPMGHQMGFIACSIGGQHQTKKMPVEQWQQLISKLTWPVVLLGGPEDQVTGDHIAQSNPVKIYNACGKFNLKESADILKRAKVVLSHDTGLMHMAAALKKPLVAIWGNTIPEFGMFPFYGQNNLLTHPSPILAHAEVDGLSCRPCSKIGYSVCPKSHFKCMKDQNLEEMIRQVDQLLQGRS